MARNEEKQLGRLNRLLLKQKETEEREKNPPRPKLESLKSADEVKAWLPSIKSEMDFYLMQSQVACYPSRKIEEFTEKINKLRRLYFAFVRRLKEFDPELTDIPWEERKYGRKRKITPTSPQDVQSSLAQSAGHANTLNHSNMDSSDNKKNIEPFQVIQTPILDKDDDVKMLYGYQDPQTVVRYNYNEDLADKPLNFNYTSESTDNSVIAYVCDLHSEHSKSTSGQSNYITGSKNPLGLEYSDTSSDDDQTNNTVVT